MAFSSISDLWNKWNIRSFVLLSLLLQVFLNLFSSMRKKTANNRVIFLLWLAYLMADWVAAFAIGLISHGQNNSFAHATGVDGAIQAFWASFLLLHLGGPDNITAFSLEDSSLWRRHLLSLIFQISAAIYVFVQIFPNDRSLMIPTMLVFLVGVIKNAERTLALNLSSLPRLREWVLSEHDSNTIDDLSILIRSPDKRAADLAYEEGKAIEYSQKDEANICIDCCTKVELREPAANTKAKMFDEIGFLSQMRFLCNMEDEVIEYSDKDEAKNDESTVVMLAYYFFQIFKVFLGDLMFTREQRRFSCLFFAKISAMDALRMLSVELQFIYEVLHTKALAIRSKLSYIFRFITFMGVVVAFILFNRLKKHQLSKLDVKITYILLFGGIVLDVIALFMLIFSDWTLAKIMQSSRSSKAYVLLYKLAYNTHKLRKPRSTTCEAEHNANVTYEALDTPLIFRRWSESISTCNLLSMSLKKSQRSLGSIASSSLFDFPSHMAERVISYFHQASEAIARGCGLRTTKGKIVIIANTKYVSKNPFLKKLWIFIFKEVRRKSRIVHELTERSMYKPTQRSMYKPTEMSMNEPTQVGHESRNTDENTKVRCESGNMDEIIEVERDELTEVEQDKLTKAREIIEARGDLFLKNLLDEKKLDEKKYGDLLEDVTKASYDDSIIMWHIATEILYNQEKSTEKIDEREFSKILSDYMLYLLLNQPNVVSAVAGIAQITAAETLEELQRHIKDTTRDVEELCMQLSENHKGSLDYAEPLKAMLWQGVKLYRKMESLGEMKWEVTSGVWVEMLSYAAIHIKGEAHVQVLSKGGELLAFMWLLMAHFGCIYKPELGICYERYGIVGQ